MSDSISHLFPLLFLAHCRLNRAITIRPGSLSSPQVQCCMAHAVARMATHSIPAGVRQVKQPLKSVPPEYLLYTSEVSVFI